MDFRIVSIVKEGTSWGGKRKGANSPRSFRNFSTDSYIQEMNLAQMHDDTVQMPIQYTTRP